MNHLGEGGLDGLTVHLGGHERVHIGGLGVADNLGDLAGETGELGVGGDEVGLAGDLGERTHAAVGGNIGGDGTLVGVAAGLLGGGGKTVLAEDVDGGVHVAIGLDERLLALHHGRIGHLAELLDHLSGNLSHQIDPFVNAVRTRPPYVWRPRTDLKRSYSAAASVAASAAGASAAISASEICSLPVPARQASANSSLMSWTAEMASSLQGTP